MNITQLSPFKAQGKSPVARGRLAVGLSLAIILVICFSKALFDLVHFSLGNELFSYVPLIPFVSAYLIWLRWDALSSNWTPSWISCGLASASGLAVLAAYWWRRHAGWNPLEEDYLAVFASAFLLLLLSVAMAVIGGRTLREIAFPVALMAFIIPYPTAMLEGINSFFDQTSAYMASAFFQMVGTPLFKEGLELHLPGIAIRVAPECSGIHSTQVLLITSLLAGYLFLQTGSRRALLTLFVIPLAIVRNGFRIWVIGELCVHISPTMIDSPIHHRGGPIFFLLSLIPFFLLLIWLRKSEQGRKMCAKPQSAQVTGIAL